MTILGFEIQIKYVGLKSNQWKSLVDGKSKIPAIKKHRELYKSSFVNAVKAVNEYHIEKFGGR